MKTVQNFSISVRVTSSVSSPCLLRVVKRIEIFIPLRRFIPVPCKLPLTFFYIPFQLVLAILFYNTTCIAVRNEERSCWNRINSIIRPVSDAMLLRCRMKKITLSSTLARSVATGSSVVVHQSSMTWVQTSCIH